MSVGYSIYVTARGVGPQGTPGRRVRAAEFQNVCKAMCCETLCALQHVAFADSNRRLYKYMDADSAAHAGPAGELPFGRFKAPECVECGTATACDDLWSE